MYVDSNLSCEVLCSFIRKCNLIFLSNKQQALLCLDGTTQSPKPVRDGYKKEQFLVKCSNSQSLFMNCTTQMIEHHSE